MRTNVEVKQDIPQSSIKKGDVGYIDGYVKAADDRPYAAVVIPSKNLVDLVSVYCLKVTGIE